MSASRWVVSGVGTVLVGASVWFFGPLWPPLEPALPRIVAVQGVALAWAVANAALDWQRRRRSDALGAGLTPTADERAAVAQSLSRALALLGKRRRVALTDLPWYAIIGPPGAGKTTALLNAGLTFPLAAELGRAPIPGAGGTRLCDWWFTDRAVLIDTAGRYTTQDSDQSVDRAGWLAFLALLKRARPAQPLNGVIVAIGATDIVQASPAERAAHAAAIAARLAELEQGFDLRLPVYALFTKVDLVTGFVEFFDDLDADGRDQVWGETFPLAPSDLDRLPTTFRGLAERIAARMTLRLAAEARPDRRLPIAGFPTQLASLVPALAAFTAAAFGPAMLRGVYLVSGTQEGTPIDRLSATMSRSFGLPPARLPHAGGQGRSYFLGRLLRDTILGEAMLVRRHPGVDRRRRARIAGFALVALLLAGTVGAILHTVQRAEQELGPIADSLASYASDARPLAADTVEDGDLRTLVPLLDRAHALADDIPPDGIALGLGQSAKLASGARTIYRDALTNALLPRLLWRLEADMRGSLPDPAQLYEKLRVYLMLGGAGPLDDAAIRNWFTANWRRTDPDDDGDLLAHALTHLDALLADPLPTVSLDTPLVQAARTSIERVPPETRVYAALKTSAAAAALAPWRPIDSLGPAGVSLFIRASGAPLTEGIPGLFTAAGLRTVLLPALPDASRRVAAESWVIGRTAETMPVGTIEQAVRALYQAEFIARWDAMLADLSVAPIGSLPQAAQALYILASPESPLRALLRSFATQLQLVPGTDPALTAHYAALLAIATGDGAALDRSLRLVADIQQTLAKLAALPLGTALPSGGEDIGASLQLEAARQPAPLGRWLASIATTSAALRTGDLRRQLSLLYNAPGGPAQACAAAIAHYPFAPAGPALTADGFTRVFGPVGALDGFLNTRLKPFIDTGTTPWTLRQPAGTPGITLAAADLALFQRAAAIRAAFFPADTNSGANIAPAFPIDVAPATPSRAGTLTLGTVAVETGKGLARPALVTWPPPSGADAALQADIPGLSLHESGFWALHRLVARGRLRPAGKTGDTLTFGNPPDSIAFTVRAPALSPALLADFRCPTLP